MDSNFSRIYFIPLCMDIVDSFLTVDENCKLLLKLSMNSQLNYLCAILKN